MFCPSCGTEYTVELKYCNRCGANLSSALTASPEIVSISLTKPTLIVAATLLLLTLGGFGALIGGALSLAEVIRGPEVLAIIPFGMIAILIVDIMLLRQLTRLINASLKSDSPTNISKQAARLQGVPQMPALSAPQLSHAASVTEHTTRFFEPAHRAPSETGNQPPAKSVGR